jgi:hypothetical protein
VTIGGHEVVGGVRYRCEVNMWNAGHPRERTTAANLVEKGGRLSNAPTVNVHESLPKQTTSSSFGICWTIHVMTFATKSFTCSSSIGKRATRSVAFGVSSTKQDIADP